MYFMLIVQTFSTKLTGHEGPKDQDSLEGPRKSEFGDTESVDAPQHTHPTPWEEAEGYFLPSCSLVFGAPGHT